jgi:hypothetical protein
LTGCCNSEQIGRRDETGLDGHALEELIMTKTIRENKFALTFRNSRISTMQNVVGVRIEIFQDIPLTKREQLIQLFLLEIFVLFIIRISGPHNISKGGFRYEKETKK